MACVYTPGFTQKSYCHGAAVRHLQAFFVCHPLTHVFQETVAWIQVNFIMESYLSTITPDVFRHDRKKMLNIEYNESLLCDEDIKINKFEDA